LTDVETLLAGLPRLEPGPLEAVVDSVLKRGDDAHRVLRDVLLWWTAERVRKGAHSDAADASALDRWATLWENIAQGFARAETANLDRKQAILEILYDIRATARAA
jgi:DNA polymerase-3 subunit delta'